MRTGNKSPVQECFFKDSAGDLLPALRFLGRQYNFCNFVIILSLMKVTICKRVTYFTDSEMIEYYQKMCGWNSKSPKTKNFVTNYTRYTMLKKSFLMVYVGTCHCCENSKTKLWSTISGLKRWHYTFLTTKRKWLQSLTMFCKFCKLLFYLLRDTK